MCFSCVCFFSFTCEKYIWLFLPTKVHRTVRGPGSPVVANSGKNACDFLMLISSDRHLERFEVQKFLNQQKHWFYMVLRIVMEQVIKTSVWIVRRIRILINRCKKISFQLRSENARVFSIDFVSLHKHRCVQNNFHGNSLSIVIGPSEALVVTSPLIVENVCDFLM